MAKRRNRLTDLKCGWKHGTPEERSAFLKWIGSKDATHYPTVEVREGRAKAASVRRARDQFIERSEEATQ